MSKEMEVTASQVPGEEPRRSSMAAKKLAAVRWGTITPLGLPVEPDV